MTTVLIEPLDVLILRGNKLFADAGSHGEALMPPWPSVAAGALRSRMLADARIDPAAFANGKAVWDRLGRPAELDRLSERAIRKGSVLVEAPLPPLALTSSPTNLFTLAVPVSIAALVAS